MEYVTDDSKKRKLNDESNGTDVPYSKEDLKKLLEPLSKDQLILLLTDAGSQYPAVAGEIRDVASKDPAHRKLFVRGLSWETTSQALCEAFEEYGEIEEGAVIVDKATGRSKGFGFITFKHMDSAQEALKEPSKHIDVANNPSGKEINALEQHITNLLSPLNSIFFQHPLRSIPRWC